MDPRYVKITQACLWLGFLIFTLLTAGLAPPYGISRFILMWERFRNAPLPLEPAMPLPGVRCVLPVHPVLAPRSARAREPSGRPPIPPYNGNPPFRRSRRRVGKWEDGKNW